MRPDPYRSRRVSSSAIGDALAAGGVGPGDGRVDRRERSVGVDLEAVERASSPGVGVEPPPSTGSAPTVRSSWLPLQRRSQTDRVRPWSRSLSFSIGCASGDEAAFVELVDTYHTRMVRFAQTFVTSHQAAEDVAQDTWIAVIRGVERFEERSSLQTWLLRICANRARTRFGADNRQVPVGAPGSTVSADRFDPNGGVERSAGSVVRRRRSAHGRGARSSGACGDREATRSTAAGRNAARRRRTDQ